MSYSWFRLALSSKCVNWIYRIENKSKPPVPIVVLVGTYPPLSSSGHDRMTTGLRVDDSPEVPGTESRALQDSGGVTAWTHCCGGNGNDLA